MCGRFTQHYTWAEVHAFLNVFGDLGTPRNLQPRYNIAPTTFIDVVAARVRNREIVGREIVPMRWGLIPSWGSRHLRAKSDAKQVIDIV
jgi:putative SOS response-associated peptidase YedK